MLLERHWPLVREAAARLAWRLPRHVDGGDLESWGAFGLMDAADKFDPGRGVRFETYAGRRIQGAMLDGIRNFDWVPRLVRARKEKVVGMGSIDLPLRGGEGRERKVADVLEDRQAPVQERLAEKEGFSELVRSLPRVSRFLLTLLYVDGMTMKEAGRAAGFSESRVSQIHSEAVGVLKATVKRAG